MIVLSCNGVGKSFGDQTILHAVSCAVEQGQKIGIVGDNGAGKTSLFRLITGEWQADEGELRIAKGQRLGYLRQIDAGAGAQTLIQEALTAFAPLMQAEEEMRSLEKQIAAHPTKQGAEYKELLAAYAHCSDALRIGGGYSYEGEAAGMLRALGFAQEEFERPLSQLSGGQRTMLSLSKLLLARPDILLLDEPTNHLDIASTAWLEEYLRGYPGTVLMISHDRYFLDKIVGRVWEIQNGTLASYHGNYSDFMQKKRLYMEQQQRMYLRSQQEIARQQEMIRRFKQHGTEKLAKRARSREKALEKIQAVERPVQNNARAKLRFFAQTSSGYEVLAVEGLTKRFADAAEPLFADVAFQVYSGDKIGLIGPNGIGKTTLLKAILGMEPVDGGAVSWGHNVQLGYYDQEHSNLSADNTVLEEIWDQSAHLAQAEVRSLLGRFLFSGEDVHKQVSALSGGERGRLSLLKLMLSGANLLIMDEPTNHLDIVSREVLEQALTDYEGTLLMVSHDRFFLNRVPGQIIALEPGGVRKSLGNYDAYLERYPMDAAQGRTMQAAKPSASSEEPTQAPAQQEPPKHVRQADERKRRLAVREAEKAIALTEQRIAELERQMALPEVYADHERVQQVHKEQDALHAQLEELYLQWEENLGD
ncbi:ABC transporter ATP-binding protein [Bacteroidia bacterium]|nr:ABC transporter ATP-binding protein [Bacteroidia bacterium]